MKDKIAETSNVLELSLGITNLQSRKEKIAVIYGRPGFGKTTALINAQNNTNGVVIEAYSTWTNRWMLASLCDALGIARSGQGHPMFEDCVKQLSITKRPIFIDEVNRLVETLSSDKGLSILSTLYAIHDAAQVPILMFGLADFRQQLRARAGKNQTVEAFNQRVVFWQEFQGCNFADAKLVAAARCEVKIEDEAIAALVKGKDYSYRDLIVSLTELERFALGNGFNSIGINEFKAWRGE